MGNKVSITNKLTKVDGWKEPLVFDLSKANEFEALSSLIESQEILRVSDNIESALEELYHVDNPSQIDGIDAKGFKTFLDSFGDLDSYGKWLYFQWSGTLVHFPSEDDLRKLRGSRNRNLINDEERKKLIDNKTILVLGLSVGSNVVDSLLMQGIGSKYILVDMDQLDPTNLNRIRSSYDQIGIHKVDIVAKKISELDPYIEQVHYKNGLNEKNLEEILSIHKPDIIVDEMDSLHMKLLVRLRAKDLSIPILMATDDGDDILLDIERFDLDNKLPILHGLIPEPVVEEILKNEKMDRRQMGAIIGKYFVNLENVPLRMIESLLEVGRTLPSWPQLGGAAVLSGLYVAYAAKKILLGQEINSGRFIMGPDKQLNPEITTLAYKSKKADLIKLMSQGPGAKDKK